MKSYEKDKFQSLRQMKENQSMHKTHSERRRKSLVQNKSIHLPSSRVFRDWSSNSPVKFELTAESVDKEILRKK